jgi:hypothetical protein
MQGRPVSASKAMALSEYKLSPGRESPFQSGEGFHVPQVIRFCSTSKDPVPQVGAPLSYTQSGNPVSFIRI